MRTSLLVIAGLMLAGCSSIIEPDLDDIQRNAIIGNWNKFESQDVFTPQGFRFQVGFRSDGKYQFVTFDFVEIFGTWKFGADGAVVISDNICPTEGNYQYSVEEGRLTLTSIDINDDECGRSERLSGEWLRSGVLDQ